MHSSQEPSRHRPTRATAQRHCGRVSPAGSKPSLQVQSADRSFEGLRSCLRWSRPVIPLTSRHSCHDFEETHRRRRIPLPIFTAYTHRPIRCENKPPQVSDGSRKRSRPRPVNNLKLAASLESRTVAQRWPTHTQNSLLMVRKQCCACATWLTEQAGATPPPTRARRPPPVRAGQHAVHGSCRRCRRRPVHVRRQG